MSDQRWQLVAPTSRPTIAIIERPTESYDAYADRREREKEAPRVPFGFSRALQEPDE